MGRGGGDSNPDLAAQQAAALRSNCATAPSTIPDFCGRTNRTGCFDLNLLILSPNRAFKTLYKIVYNFLLRFA